VTATLPHIDPGNQEWRDSALCAQTDPEIFFPDKGDSCQTAKLICGRCPVREECLQDALTNLTAMQDLFGVRGGTSPRERGRIRARRNAQRLREAS
jgi:WhiB family redox-sensing transcriptional regulator